MKDNINIEQRNQRIIERAQQWNRWKNDPIAFFEECCFLPTSGGDKRILLYPPQKKIINEFYNNHYLILLKSRQIGFSTLCQLIATHLCIFYDNVNIGIMSRTGSEASEFNKKILDIIDKIEYNWMKPKFTVQNARNFKLENGSGVSVGSVSMANPGSIFRGSSLTVLFCDEAAFIQKVDIAWAAVGPTLSVAQKDAKEAGIPYGNIILSTPNKKTGIGEWFYKRYMNALDEQNEGSALYKVFKIHWKEVPRLKDDPTWYSDQCQILGNDPKRIAQELDLQFIGAEDSIFTDEIQLKLNEIMDIDLNKYKKIDTIYGPIILFKKYNVNSFYFIGIDCAGMVGASGTDYSVIQVIEYPSMDQILEFRSKIEPRQFSEIVQKVISFFPHNLIIIERTGGYSQIVIDSLVYNKERIYNIYHESIVKTNNNGVLEVTKTIPGLNTDRLTRKVIIESLYNYVNNYIEKIISPRLALELLSLTRHNDKIEADNGFHDDLVMALGFIFYIINYKPEAYFDDVNNLKLSMNNDEINLIDNISESLIIELNSSKSNVYTNTFQEMVQKEKDKYMKLKDLKEKRKTKLEQLQNQQNKQTQDENEDNFVYDIFDGFYTKKSFSSFFINKSTNKN